jgi:dihydropyrimidinase
MSVLIKNGRVVTAADDYVADVFIDGERVTMIGESLDLDADRVIDATGKYLLPGCVDPHTHLDMPFGGTVTIDDVESGQTAAAFGGTTCHVDFCIQGKGQTFADALAGWHAKAAGKQVIDMGYHIAITDLSQDGARNVARPRRHLVQAVHGLQGRAPGRRRDALQGDGGGSR